ncbi:MAG: DNA-binding protein WhiA [Lachnospiraceae bacterium]|nr:DNA-binding protein WhiA [Lachnospiraceae bacterium]MBP3753846.1 DNA-binding protein WhiA [Lachnospiraceae bacterium]
MSFSSDVKEELAGVIPQARHCRIAELSAIMHMAGQIGVSEGEVTIGFNAFGESLIKKGFTLLEITFNIGKSLRSSDPEFESLISSMGDLDDPVSELTLKNTCCKRAFLRGAFLASGSVSDPDKGYHLEFVCEDESKADQIVRLCGDFEINARKTLRRDETIVYVKEGEMIGELLSVMGAQNSYMDFENRRIYKDVSNTVNRRVNCETSNIRKTVTAASKQLDDIRFLEEHGFLDDLPDTLKEAAYGRLENPDATLAELGALMDPPVGKSGINHRLLRLSDIARQKR